MLYVYLRGNIAAVIDCENNPSRAMHEYAQFTHAYGREYRAVFRIGKRTVSVHFHKHCDRYNVRIGTGISFRELLADAKASA